MAGLRRGLSAGWLLLALALAPWCQAQSGLPEYQVKAAFLYQFLKYVDWPAKAFGKSTDPVIIGVLGVDDFGTALPQVVVGKTINDRPIVIRSSANLSDLKNSHLLFVSRSERQRIGQVLNELRSSYALTVGDTDGFAEAGGMINLKLEDDKIRFEINVQAATQAGLRISSRLLSVARIVPDAKSSR